MESIKKLKITALADDYAGGGRCLAQHGVSYFIEIEDQEETHFYLFDTGLYHEPIVFNAKRLGIPLDKIEKIILSHSHYDHTGGLIGLLENLERKEREVIAHPEVFKKSYYPSNLSKNIGIENEQAKEVVEQLNGKWLFSTQPLLLDNRFTFLGEIPRVTDFEEELTIQLQTKKNNIWIDDLIEDDSAIYIHTPKGIIIIAGCSHSGIVNIVKHAKKVSGDLTIYAVIGGFHLLSASEERILKTANQLKVLGVERLITGHCTGGVAEYLFHQTFQEDFQKLYAGKKLEFSF